MKLPDVVVEGVVRTEQALDRLKLAYKARFDRFAPARIVPYRGHGRADHLMLSGRVLEANETGFQPDAGVVASMRNTIRRLETDEIRGARLRARFGDMTLDVEANDEAFFHLELEPSPPVEPGWHQVELEVLESMAERSDGPVTGEVLVPPDDADFIVVSDLDDTVVRTGATTRFSMFRTVLMNDAHSRLPFQGVRALYRALESGPSGGGRNPFFYLSRSPWNLYDMLTGFLDHRGLPKGPLLLKDYGLRGMLEGKEQPYKREALTHLLDFYPEHRFVLIGDSGQHDPEVYREIALDCPDRIGAIIIRDVTPPARDREVREIAAEMERHGVPMVLAADSHEAARDAADLGLMDEARVEEVEVERESEEEAPSLYRRVLRRTFRSGSGDGRG